MQVDCRNMNSNFRLNKAEKPWFFSNQCLNMEDENLIILNVTASNLPWVFFSKGLWICDSNIFSRVFWSLLLLDYSNPDSYLMNSDLPSWFVSLLCKSFGFVIQIIFFRLFRFVIRFLFLWIRSLIPFMPRMSQSNFAFFVCKYKFHSRIFFSLLFFFGVDVCLPSFFCL